MKTIQDCWWFEKWERKEAREGRRTYKRKHASTEQDQ